MCKQLIECSLHSWHICFVLAALFACLLPCVGLYDLEEEKLGRHVLHLSPPSFSPSQQYHFQCETDAVLFYTGQGRLV
ncbi:hypothetical protein V8C40DRAFT_232139, partial [Trichoderma camerunense]